MNDQETSRQIAVAAGKLLQDGVMQPLTADTAPVPEGQNGCEGDDCISYDFPCGMVVKGKR